MGSLRGFRRARPLTSYSKVQVWIAALVRNRRFQISSAVRGKRLLNVGCGNNVHPEFINLDYTWRPGMDICWDITKRLPLEDKTIDGIFTEHCLEHVGHSECIGVLKEFFRILAPGGAVRIVVPDAGLYLDLYQRWKAGDTVPFPYVGGDGELDRLDDSRVQFTPMMAVNRIFRGYGHHFAYDFETLASMLSHVGFVKISRTGFGDGRMASLLIDSELRRPQSLYVEASRGS